MFGISMRKSIVLLLAAVFAVLMAIVAFASRAVSGGEKTFVSVAGALKTNSFLLGQIGSPVKVVAEKEGPSTVYFATDGRRHGFYSVKVEGPRGGESLKVYWRELPGGLMEVHAIYRTKAWSQDKQVWGTPRPELH
jgi:hypothetical protein